MTSLSQRNVPADLRSVTHNTFVIEKSLAKPPGTVFRAFSEPSKKRSWFGEGPGHDVETFESDFRPGGKELARYRFKEGTPFPGVELANEGTYLDVVPDKRIVTASTMSLGGKRISASLVTFEFFPDGESGTTLIFTHQGAFFEGADGPEMREAGWRSLLEQLGAELSRG